MKRLLLAAMALTVCGMRAAAPPAVGAQPTDGSDAPPALRTGMVPIGSLGRPLGTYLTLEGRRADGFKAGVQTLRVDKIDGVALDKPLDIWVDNVDLPAHQTCIIKGYETVRMIGQAPAVEQAAKERGQTISAPQAGWQIQAYFVALRAVSPDGLKIDRNGR